jgi:DNA-binding XRE family transcriptional regulator
MQICTLEGGVELATMPEGGGEKKGKGGRPPGPLTPFGLWLKDQQEWTVEKMAKALGVSTGYIYALRNGTRNPTKLVVLAVAKVTNDAFKEEDWKVPIIE